MHRQIDSPFSPKFFSMLREGYSGANLRQDAIAGLTVAIVALPLSMAIAIASGASPERGLYTAIIGGFLISLLGGSRHQIGGPAGAFIVLIAAIIERHSYDGLLLATIMAGLIMIALGALKLGTLIKFIPQPVIIGFTSGIAIIIFASQIKELLGLSLADKEPSAFIPKLIALYEAIGTLNPAAIGVALASIALILGLKHIWPKAPGFLLAVVLSAVLVKLFAIPVETIGSRFGAIPSALPAPAVPFFSFAKMQAVFPDALAIGLLGAIESLLSAVVADGMTGRRHRSNTELVAQGVGNIASALFGGICATGTIARTATNVRSNAYGPVSGMLHAVYLLGFMMLLAPFMAFIPLAALGAILAIVSWNMAERHAVMALLRGERGDALVLLATLLLTVFRDLTEGILVGILLGSILFSVRMAKLVEISTHQSAFSSSDSEVSHIQGLPEDVMVYRVSGPLFFGSTPGFADLLTRVGWKPRAILLDFAQVPFADASGVQGLKAVLRSAKDMGARVIIAGASRPVIETLMLGGIGRGMVKFVPNLAAAARIVNGSGLFKDET